MEELNEFNKQNALPYAILVTQNTKKVTVDSWSHLHFPFMSVPIS